MKLTLVLLSFFITTAIVAQDSTAVDDLNFEEFGDADDKVIKTYCTQKVNYLSPTKLISVGYEYQNQFQLADFGGTKPMDAALGGLRLAFNAPVISRSNFILNLGLNYWNSTFNFHHAPTGSFLPNIKQLTTTGINATIFKPLNNKNFMILQASGDLNGNYWPAADFSGSKVTISGTAIYGWKKDDNQMFGLGLTRTYRAGALLHIPVIFYNKTYNKKWGLESIFPARVHVRRNFSPSSYLMAGYEIEGNSFYVAPKNLSSTQTYLRRGELKPRIMYETKLSGFVWLSAQVGWRYNYRFELHNNQNPTKNEVPLFKTEDFKMGNPLYFNVSVNLVSP